MIITSNNELNNILDNNNTIGDNIDDSINKKKFQRFKFIIYKKEQKEILDKVFNILSICDNNNIFQSHIIDHNSNIQNKILELDDNIKKYFKTSTWPAYKNFNIERRYLSIIKSIMKDMDVIYTSLSCKIKYNNRIVNSTIYTIDLEKTKKNLELL